MARPREFDADRALARATAVFWAKGYEAASLDDLCAATGLNRSSLYGAFGDKRALYLQALERYERDGTARIAAALAKAPVKRAFEGFVGRIIDDIAAGPGRRGCFIGNCAAEMARLDRTAAARVKQSLARIEQSFHAALTRGGVPKSRSRARFITAAVQGLRLVGKANPDRDALEDIAAQLMHCLDH